MAKTNIHNLVPYLVEKGGMGTKDAEHFVQSMFDIIQEALHRDGHVKVKGFGTFKIVAVEPRESVNIHTGERVLIEGHNKISFVPDSVMKEQVNKPFSLFETVILNEGVEFNDTLSEVVEKMDDESLSDLEVESMLEQFQEEQEESPEPIIDLVMEEESEPLPAEEEKPESRPIITFETEPESEAFTKSEPEPESQSVEDQKPQPVEDQKPQPSEDQKPLPVEERHPVSESESEAKQEPMVHLVDDVKEERGHSFEDDEENSRNWWFWAISAAMALLIGAGFYWFNQRNRQDVPADESASVVVADTLEKEEPDTLEVVLDSINKPDPAVDEPTIAEPVAPEAQKETPEPAKEEVPEEKYSEEQVLQMIKDAAMYERIDSRLIGKSFYIAGFQREVYAAEGENLLKIAARTVGAANVCYLSVYNSMNDTIPLKKGQKIYIPKLVSKSKVSK